MPDPRIPLGKLVRNVWVKWAYEQPDPKPSWLLTWSEIDDGQREAGMRIGAAVAAAERERILAAAREAAFTLFRPGLGSGEAHGRAMEVVPLEALREVTGG